MAIVRHVLDAVALGSERPIRRLVAYYTVLLLGAALVLWIAPGAWRIVYEDVVQSAPDAPFLLQDGLNQAATETSGPGPSGFEALLLTALALGSTLLLMLPVSWVYMSARHVRGHSQALVHTLLILPIVVAGVVFVVRNSLALAFSLAGVVAAVRFRNNLRDTRDVVYVFLAIAVGFAAGVYNLGIGAMVSMIFNFVVLLTWRYDFGRNVLSPTAASEWKDPLSSLAATSEQKVPDRELLLALTPAKLSALAARFDRVRNVLGNGKRKPRFNAVLSVATEHVSEAQPLIQQGLDAMAKRWVLDEVVTNTGKPSELYYLVRLTKKTMRDEVITAVRARAGDLISSVDLEIAVSVDEEEAA